MDKFRVDNLHDKALSSLTEFLNNLDIPKSNKDNIFFIIEDCIISIMAEGGYYE